MARAPEKKVEETPQPKQKVNYDIKGLASYASNLIAVHQFHNAVYGHASPTLADAVKRATDELTKALEDA